MKEDRFTSMKMKKDFPTITDTCIRYDSLPRYPAIISGVIKFMRNTFGASKKLSDYAKHIKSEDEALFEKVKKEQLSRAFSQTQQSPWISLLIIGLGADIALLSARVPPSDPPTKQQIFFWAMLEAFLDYMKREPEDFVLEVAQLLTIDMARQFCRLIVDGMNIAAKEKQRLLKRMDALEIIVQDKLNEKHPPRPTLTIQEAAAACGVDPKTISRWEKYRKGEEGGTEPPAWYRGRNMTAIELMTRAEDGRAQKRMAQATRRSLKNASRYIEDHDQPADDDE